MLQLSMKENDKREQDTVVGNILSPTLTVDEKTDEEVYKEAFDHFDGNHSKTIPTSVSDQELRFWKWVIIFLSQLGSFQIVLPWSFKSKSFFVQHPESDLRAAPGWA